MNDKEFCHECKKRGIKVFSVLWKAQLWEFAAEFNEDESELLSLNILRDAGEHKYLGMSELSTNRYPKLFDPIEKYFPNGLLDYKGKRSRIFCRSLKQYLWKIGISFPYGLWHLIMTINVIHHVVIKNHICHI